MKQSKLPTLGGRRHGHTRNKYEEEKKERVIGAKKASLNALLDLSLSSSDFSAAVEGGSRGQNGFV